MKVCIIFYKYLCSVFGIFGLCLPSSFDHKMVEIRSTEFKLCWLKDHD